MTNTSLNKIFLLFASFRHSKNVGITQTDNYLKQCAVGLNATIDNAKMMSKKFDVIKAMTLMFGILHFQTVIIITAR